MGIGWLDNSFLLLLGAAAVWFVLRFILGPKRGAPTLGSFFRREPAATVEGLGRKAIATLLEDSKAFVMGENALRGLLLAGPFAARSATITSSVTLIALCDVPESYAEPDWLLRWAYPARGHKVLEQQVVQEPGHVSHRLALRGAPPVEVHFIVPDRAAPPEVLLDALKCGVSVVDDAAGQAERLRRHWENLYRSDPAGKVAGLAPKKNTTKEDTP